MKFDIICVGQIPYCVPAKKLHCGEHLLDCKGMIHHHQEYILTSRKMVDHHKHVLTSTIMLNVSLQTHNYW